MEFCWWYFFCVLPSGRLSLKESIFSSVFPCFIFSGLACFLSYTFFDYSKKHFLLLRSYEKSSLSSLPLPDRFSIYKYFLQSSSSLRHLYHRIVSLRYFRPTLKRFFHPLSHALIQIIAIKGEIQQKNRIFFNKSMNSR